MFRKEAIIVKSMSKNEIFFRLSQEFFDGRLHGIDDMFLWRANIPHSGESTPLILETAADQIWHGIDFTHHLTNCFLAVSVSFSPR